MWEIGRIGGGGELRQGARQQGRQCSSPSVRQAAPLGTAGKKLEDEAQRSSMGRVFRIKYM